MGGSATLRKALLTSGVLAAALVGAAATAQEGHEPDAASNSETQANQIDFTDPHAALEGASVNLTSRTDQAARFSPSRSDRIAPDQQPRSVELELAAGGGDAPLDVSIAQRASFGGNANGDIDRRGQGSELRIGRGLVEERQGSRTPSTYVFVASDNEALTWQPGSRSEFGGQGSSFALQDRVEVGDLSAGVTYERNGVQASLAYVEREESTRIGNQTYSQDESFTGVTVTMRR